MKFDLVGEVVFVAHGAGRLWPRNKKLQKNGALGDRDQCGL